MRAAVLVAIAIVVSALVILLVEALFARMNVSSAVATPPSAS